MSKRKKNSKSAGGKYIRDIFLGLGAVCPCKEPRINSPSTERVRAVLTQPLVWGERARVWEYFSRGTTRVDIVIIIIVIYSDHLAFFVSAPPFHPDWFFSVSHYKILFVFRSRWEVNKDHSQGPDELYGLFLHQNHRTWGLWWSPIGERCGGGGLALRSCVSHVYLIDQK